MTKTFPLCPSLTRMLPLAVAVAALCGTAACKKDEPKPVEKPPVVADTGAQGTAAPTPPPAVEPVKESNPLCVGRAATTPEEAFEVGGKKFERKGSTLTLVNPDADDELIIGQVSDIKDHTPENAANLKVVLEWFKKEKVDAIAVTGDIGESAASVEAVLNDVAAVGVPVFAIVGNRECRDDYVKGVQAAQQKSKTIINLNEIRVVNLDEVSFVSLPGYYNKSYIHCAEGCEYTTNDVKELTAISQAATAPVKTLISHGPPLQSGALAIDRIHEGANVGDPALAELMKSGLFAFGLFGNIQEAGGYATDLGGTTRVPAETWADALYFNPGPLDSVRWVMLDNTESVGMAGLVKWKGKQASYKTYRLKPGEAKVENKGG